jgi:hypothetical protein
MLTSSMWVTRPKPFEFQLPTTGLEYTIGRSILRNGGAERAISNGRGLSDGVVSSIFLMRFEERQ